MGALAPVGRVEVGALAGEHGASVDPQGVSALLRVDDPKRMDGATATGGEVPSRYRVHLLPRAKPTEKGVLYLRGDEQFLLAWDRVKHAFAAQVGRGERAGVVVFDLAVLVSGPECVACRVEASPLDAPRVARAIELGVAAGARTPGLCALAHEGVAHLSFPDLETLSEAALESVRFPG